MSPFIHSFAPFAARSPHLLILGSMPGAVSLKQQQYYAHKRNAFWSIMAQLVGFAPSLPYDKRLAALGRAGVALWDVLAACQRQSSLDQNIKNETANDIAGFLQQHASIRAVFLNGGKAAASFRRFAIDSDMGLAVHALPSTSPAHARMDGESKYHAWRKAWDETQGMKFKNAVK